MSDAATPPATTHPDDDVVTYTAVLPLPRRVVVFVADLLADHQAQVGTRTGRRAAGAWDQALAFCRWMLDGVEPDRLAVDLGIGGSTVHRYMARPSTSWPSGRPRYTGR